MSQKFAKKQVSHPTTYNKTFNGSVVVGTGQGRNIVDQLSENKVVYRPLLNAPIAESTRPVSIPAGSGVYLA